MLEENIHIEDSERRKSVRLHGKPSLHARFAMEDWQRRRWWVTKLPVLALIVTGVLYDWKYIVIGGIIYFTIFPMAWLIGWIKSLSNPDAVRAVWDFEIEADIHGYLTIEYFLPEELEKKRRRQQKKRKRRFMRFYDADAEEEADEEPTPMTEEERLEAGLPAPVTLSTATLTDAAYRRNNIVLDFKEMRLVIPFNKANQDNLTEVLDFAGVWKLHNNV